MSAIHTIEVSEEITSELANVKDGMVLLLQKNGASPWIAMPIDAAKEFFIEKIAEIWAQNPPLLVDLKDRLENEEAEEWVSPAD